MKVGELSEAQLLARVVPLLPQGNRTLVGPGDDAAVVAVPGGDFAVTTDVLVEDVHFRRHWSSGFQVGARAAAQNLSDIAAMGATPWSLVVSLVLPPDLDVAWVEDFAQGMAAEVFPTGAGVVGGDLSRGEKLVISVTAHGGGGGQPVLRSGARPGDTVAVAGTLGQAAAGLAALSSGVVAAALQGNDVPYPFTKPVELYRVPRPPLEAGPLAKSRGATAMIDVSDGLVIDARRVAQASGVSIDLTRYGLQASAADLDAAANQLGQDPYQWVLFGGEDQALLATFPPYVLVTDPFFPIGVVGEAGFGQALVTLDGAALDEAGFDHFQR